MPGNMFKLLVVLYTIYAVFNMFLSICHLSIAIYHQVVQNLIVSSFDFLSDLVSFFAYVLILDV